MKGQIRALLVLTTLLSFGLIAGAGFSGGEAGQVNHEQNCQAALARVDENRITHGPQSRQWKMPKC